MKAAKICAIYLLVALICTVSAKHKKVARVVNGQIITIDKAPYIVQLREPKEDFTICGGTLITTQHVVTAAHCFIQYKREDITVVGGASLRTDKGERRQIDVLSKHPQFDTSSMHYDVAVLKLDKPFVLSHNIQVKSELCSQSPQDVDFIQVSGWGQKGENSPVSKELRTVRLPVVSHEECAEKMLGTPGKITSTMMCAYIPTKDGCVYDSGGPGIIRGELCGIVSWGIGCARKDLPGVYTNVFVVRDFIEEKIKV